MNDRIKDRISVSGICSNDLDVAEDLALWERHGVKTISVPARKIGVGDARRIADAGLRVTTVLTLGPSLEDHTGWPSYRDQLEKVFTAAAAMSSESVTLTTGSAYRLPWLSACEALGELLAPVRDLSPCPLLLENTNQLRADISFVYRLADALEVARLLDLGVLMEVTACWRERALEDTIASGASSIGLVQLSDLAPVVLSTPNRLVPGDGVLPLDTIVRQLLAAGYDGPFELEYLGPRIEEEGYDRALGRALDALHRILADALSLPSAGGYPG